MSIPSSSPQTFGWIKSALTDSMTEVKNSIDVAVSSEDPTALGSVPKNLHQIQGSLQMVELEAAGMLADDLELLAHKISNGELENVAPALEALKGGVGLLDIYLDSIENQTPISPLAMVDEMNHVRQFAGLDQLTRFDLFDPPLNFGKGISDSSVIRFPDDKRSNVLFHLRKRFRQALAAWLNDRDRDRALEVMQDLMFHLHRVGGPEVLQQLWWVASGFVQAVKSGMISPDTDVKAQFAQLDVEMSRMKDNRFSEIASSPPDELLRQMLYFIGSAKVDADSGESFSQDQAPDPDFRPDQIKQMLELDQWFTFEIATKTNPFADVIGAAETMSGEITEENFQLLENQMDLYFSGELDPEQELELVEMLEVLDNHMSGYEPKIFGEFSNALLQAARNADIEQEELLRSGADIKIASALLFLKHTLDDPESIGEVWMESANQRIADLKLVAARDHDSKADAAEVPQGTQEYADARGAVVWEVRRRLAEIEEGLSENTTGSIGDVSEWIKELGPWFEMLNETQVGALCRATGQCIDDLTDPLPVSQVMRESFAFVIASIGVCTDFVAQGHSVPTEIVGRAREVLESIGAEEDLDAGLADTIESDQDAVLTTTEADAGDSGLAEEPQFGQLADDYRFESADELVTADLEDAEIFSGDAGKENPPVISIEEDDDVDIDIAMREIEVVNAESIIEQIDQLDEVRKKLQSGDDINGNALHLSLLFNSIEDSAEVHRHDKTRELAALGSVLTGKIVNSELEYNDESEEFLGRLSRQIRELENDPDRDVGDSMKLWSDSLDRLSENSEIVAPGDARSVEFPDADDAAPEGFQARDESLPNGESKALDDVDPGEIIEFVDSESEQSPVDHSLTMDSEGIIEDETDQEDFDEIDDSVVELHPDDQSLSSDSEGIDEDEADPEGSQGADATEFDQELMEIFIEELGQHAEELRNIAGRLESELEDEG